MTHRMVPKDSRLIVYDIRNDLKKLGNMQSASLSAGPWGVAIEHGGIGSPEWWLALESGQIKLEEFVGRVSGTDHGAMGDTLEVHLRGDEGTQNWMAWTGFDDTIIGKTVCTRFVRLTPKRPAVHRAGYLVPVLLQVELKE